MPTISHAVELSKVAEIVYGYSDDYTLIDADKEKGAFLQPILLRCKNPVDCNEPHDIEAFGPVSTIMPYSSTKEVIKITNMGKGSLVGSIFTSDDDFAREVVMGTSTFHGRLMIINSKCAKESTGHGSPLPHLIHGGPGRAGGGEELGGILGIKFYLQRTALQGSPSTLTYICNEWITGAHRLFDNIHPFKKHFEELRIEQAFCIDLCKQHFLYLKLYLS
jgi:oxepin-CoA hydrolase / 3-oxo-5,6-dehydrosuberyl-CoA semialdehyde dehydrogenase